MKKVLVISIIVSLLACCGNSSSLDSEIKQIDKAIEKIEKSKDSMTPSDWEALEKEVEKPLQTIQDAIESGKLNSVQRIKLITVTARWSVAVMEAGFSEIEKQTGIERDKWGEEIEKFSKEMEKVSEEMEKTAKEFEK